MTPPRTIILVAVVVAATCLARPAGAQVTRVVGPEVRQVIFDGNVTFAEDLLERAIVTSETRCRHWALFFACPFGLGLRRAELREVEVERDAARLRIWYQQRGFREASVTAETFIEVDETAVVRFHVTEGTPVIADSIAYVGAEDVAAPNLLSDLPIRAGDRWSTLQLDATRDTLTRRLMSRGYPYADVLRQTVFPVDEPYRAHVTFEIEPGTYARYGEIQVAGIDNLSESTILRTLPFRSGDPYRVDQLVDAQNRLFGLEMVTSASITPNLQSDPDSLVPLLVQVQESDPYRVRSGVGWSRSECLNAESVWTSRNFMGGGRVLQVRGRLANILSPSLYDNWWCRQVGQQEYTELTWLAALDFSQPWIFSTRNSFNASLFAERQSVPEVFIRHAVGLQLAIVRAVGPRTPLTLSYRPELSRLEAAEVLLCTGFLVCTDEDIGVLTSSQRLAPVGLNLTRDLSNSLLNPTSGYRLIVDLEHASDFTGSEFRYDRAVVEGTWYSSLVGSAVLATRIRGGWVGSDGDPGSPSEIIPPQKRFYAGGANSVRGFAQSRLGPRVLVVTNPESLLTKADTSAADCTVDEVANQTCDATGASFESSRPTGGTRVLEGNAEIRIGLGSDIEAVTFLDVGQVWGTEQSIQLDALELTPGIGLRYLSPVGPLRLDLGYNFRGDQRLSVITTQIQPDGVGGYTTTNNLVELGPPVLFGGSESRFQLHISIGQAF
jgi:outer membrane protein assembly factor BamA